MKWPSKKVLVTGAGGFIGSHLTEALLRQGAAVTALVHYNSRHRYGWLEQVPPELGKSANIVLGDVRDGYAVRKLMKGHDVVFHLAALIGIPYSYIAPEAYVETNIKGTLNILQAALETGVERLVHTSTSEVYGTARYVPIDEAHPLQGQSPYSASKIGADKLAESFWRSFSLPVVTVRPFNTYGPRQSSRAVIPTIISQALRSREIRLGSLDPVRDLTFVTDTAAGFIAAAEGDGLCGETIHLGSGKGISVGGLVEAVSSLLNQKLQVVTEEERTRPSGSEVLQLISNPLKASRLMGWSPRVSLKEGISRTITWMVGYPKDYGKLRFIY